MKDIVSVPPASSDLGLFDTQTSKAGNILSIQLGSLRYAPDLGIDLKYFLDPDFQFQNESFKAYLIQVLANNSINVASVLESIDNLYSQYIFNLSPAESDGSLVAGQDMSFSSENGYLPLSIEAMMNIVMENVNTQFGTAYTTDSFVGTNFYKYFYALVQRLQENEIKTSEIFLKLQDYFAVTNESLARPNTTRPGLVDYFESNGYQVSVKEQLEAEAGELRVALNLDDSDPDYAEQKTEVVNILKTCVPAGIFTVGTETEAVVLSNAQSFDFSFNLATKIPILLRLTLTLSDNNTFTVLSTESSAATLFANINARYAFGMNFEPQRYFSVIDAPWAASVLLEYSIDDGANWLDDIAELDYDELYTFELADISVVEA